jgi:site-specific recombinase XerD
VVPENGPTFGAAVDDWLRYLEVEKRRKPSTLESARSVARRLIARFEADKPLVGIGPSDIDAFRRELLASELAIRTAQNTLVLLNSVFRLARRRSLIDSNPCDDVERIALVDDETFNVLQPAEFEVGLSSGARRDRRAPSHGAHGRRDRSPERT